MQTRQLMVAAGLVGLLGGCSGSEGKGGGASGATGSDAGDDTEDADEQADSGDSGEDPTDFGPPVPSRIEISPLGMFTEAGQTRQLTAVVKDQYGAVMDGDSRADARSAAPDITWSSSDPDVFTVDADGTVTATGEVGSALILASVDGHENVPVLGYFAHPAAGVVQVSDAEVLSQVERDVVGAPGGFGNAKHVVLHEDTPVAEGSLVLSVETASVSGRVVAIETSDLGLSVTMEEVHLSELFAELDIDEVVPMAHVPAVHSEQALELFAPVEFDGELTYLPQEAATFGPPSALPSVSLKDVCKGDLDLTLFKLNVSKPTFTFANKSGDDNVRLQMSEQGVRTIDLDTTFKGKLKGSVSFLASAKGSVTCDLVFFAKPVPITGGLADLLGGLNIIAGVNGKLAASLEAKAVEATADFSVERDIKESISLDGTELEAPDAGRPSEEGTPSATEWKNTSNLGVAVADGDSASETVTASAELRVYGTLGVGSMAVYELIQGPPLNYGESDARHYSFFPAITVDVGPVLKFKTMPMATQLEDAKVNGSYQATLDGRVHLLEWFRPDESAAEAKRKKDEQKAARKSLWQSVSSVPSSSELVPHSLSATWSESILRSPTGTTTLDPVDGELVVDFKDADFGSPADPAVCALNVYRRDGPYEWTSVYTHEADEDGTITDPMRITVDALADDADNRQLGVGLEPCLLGGLVEFEVGPASRVGIPVEGDGHPNVQKADLALDPFELGKLIGNAVYINSDLNRDGFAEVVLASDELLVLDGQLAADGIAMDHYASESDGVTLIGTAVRDELGELATRPELESFPLEGWAGRNAMVGGDVDGDGYDDLVVGIQPLSAVPAGGIQILWGSEDGPSTSAHLSLGGDSYPFGTTLADPRDIDGDGAAELLLGLPDDNGFLVLSGTELGSLGGAGLPYPEGSLGSLVSEPTSVETAGQDVSWADTDGDGLAELLVQGERWGEPSGVFVLEDYTIGSVAGFDDALALRGDEGGYCGLQVEGLGDVNADGYEDFAVGCFAESSTEKVDAYVVRGRYGLTLYADTLLSAAADIQVKGEQDYDLPGLRLLGPGDITGDGRAELVMGAPNADGVSTSDTIAGRTYIMDQLGEETATVHLSTAQHVIVGSEQDAESGASIAVGDITGDGWPELAIGAPGANSFTGRMYLFEGPDPSWER